MPPVVAAAAVSAAAGIGGGLLARSSANHATDAQRKANAEALTYERQHEAAAQAREDANRAAYAKYRDAYLLKYQPDVAANMGLRPAGAQPAGYAHGMVQPGQAMGGQGRTLAALVGGTQGAAAPVPSGMPPAAAPDVAAAPAGVAAKPITDLDWADWKRYGAGA